MIRWLLIVTNLLLLAMLGVAVGIIVKFAPLVPRLPDDLRLLAATPTTEVFARDGQLIGALGSREYVSIEQISPNFIKAITAVEDKRFFQHHGIDHIALTRALYLNLTSKGRAPGGSSITQQLVKNLFFSFKRSWERKVLEALAAIAIEHRFTKEEILETYCNLIYFGRYAYGIENAALLYFNKHASELTMEEAALLAGIPNAPARFDPYNHLEAAKKRQALILKRMAGLGHLTQATANLLAAKPLMLAPRPESSGHGSYPFDYALEIARREVGAELVNYGGVKIRTSIDLRLQRFAEEVVSSGVDLLELNLKPGNADGSRLEGGLVAVDMFSGKIAAIVGGRNYNESPFNRATNSLRQPGSSFKPVIYLTALEKLDINTETIYEDKPVTFEIVGSEPWSPRNFDPDFLGEIPLREALAKSVNTVAAQLINETGANEVVRTAKNLGIETKLKPTLSLALGAGGVTIVDMATAIGSIARMGEVIEPVLVTSIEGPGGELLEEFLPIRERRFSHEKCYQLVQMMEGVIEHGTGTVVRRRGLTGPVIGKTGTSSDYRDSWFVGATPALSVAVWVGFDDNRQMFLSTGKGVTGASGAAPIWTDFLIKATEGEPMREFEAPPVLKDELIRENFDFLKGQEIQRSPR